MSTAAAPQACAVKCSRWKGCAPSARHDGKNCYVAVDKIMVVWEARDDDHRAGFVPMPPATIKAQEQKNHEQIL